MIVDIETGHSETQSRKYHPQCLITRWYIWSKYGTWIILRSMIYLWHFIYISFIKYYSISMEHEPFMDDSSMFTH